MIQRQTGFACFGEKASMLEDSAARESAWQANWRIMLEVRYVCMQ